MFPYVFLEVTGRLETMAAIIKCAMERSFSCMNPHVGVQVALFCERFAAAFVRTDVGSFSSLLVK